eukprot:TRINITY_DN5226_c0_g1_i8.p1 TRINITY_DN5226_c0_g1~~TRINITY_DN5226_c0_g1_i8.p1  ORF type:complete len:494 (-),score=105.97 TRINITY_DN5226_c0_g1_i8:52-1533(-)
MSDLYGFDEDDEIDNESADRSVNNESLMDTIETQRFDLCEAQCEIEQQRQQLSIAAVAGLALQERIQSLSEQLSLVIQEKIQVDQKAEELTKDIELKTTRERELTSKLQHALDQNLDLEENYSQLKSLMTEKTVTYQKDLDQKNLEIEELYNIIAKSETDYNAQLKKYQGDIQQLKQELLARQAHILHQQSILEQTERDLSAFRAVAASQNHNHKDADVQLAEMRVKCAVLREEKTILESQLSIARNVVSKALRLLVTSGYISEHSPITKSDDPDLDDVLFEMNAVEEKYKRDAVRATLAPRTHENLHHYDFHPATKSPDRIPLSKHAQPEFHPDVTPIVQHRHQAEEVVAELISQDAKSDWDTAFEVAVESPKLQKSNQDRIRNRSQPSQSVTSLLWADRQSTSNMTEHESSSPSKTIDRNAPSSQSNIANTPRGAHLGLIPSFLFLFILIFVIIAASLSLLTGHLLLFPTYTFMWVFSFVFSRKPDASCDR